MRESEAATAVAMTTTMAALQLCNAGHSPVGVAAMAHTAGPHNRL